ncbi:hypothetical protein [Nocardioides sp.]|uniref:hypothetical protein n=1 Tax=Nocardioides sp. TaxID=35761 RepID=UPI00262F3B88|nr:hypothetical protein [Nocardioides sp.]MCW2737516.1 hypothetical protein [Nocardioides sp.]
MDQPHPAVEPGPGPGWYRIRIQGRLDPRWSSWFDGMTVTRDGDGATVLRGPVDDQAALHGLIERVRDLGLTLLEVTHEAPQPPPTPPTRRNPR